MINLDNKIIHGDCIEKMAEMLDNYFDLIIADPHYWKVIGQKLDYKWKLETDYIDWCNDWFKQVFRILRYGGTFYLFGYFRILSLLVSKLLDLGFDLRQQIIINK